MHLFSVLFLLREIAETLEALAGFALAVLDSKVELIVDGKPIDEEGLALFRDWVSGTEMQGDIRSWADELDLVQELEYDD